jgi:hypothetical protein
VLEDSSTYRFIFNKGRALGIREALLLQGRHNFGLPDQATLNALETITEAEDLLLLSLRLLKVSSWQELFAPLSALAHRSV